jgi:low temperature requirement protein LtrA
MANLADSFALSTRIRFSVHTGVHFTPALLMPVLLLIIALWWLWQSLLTGAGRCVALA